MIAATDEVDQFLIAVRAARERLAKLQPKKSEEMTSDDENGQDSSNRNLASRSRCSVQ